MTNRSSKLFQRVYEVVKRIPSGSVATYGQIAEIIGTKDARKIGPRTELTSRRSLAGSRSRGAFMRGKWAISPRVVGFALHANTYKDVPCHRVVNKDGRLAQKFAFDGPREQRRRLLDEGVKFRDEMHVDLESCLWQVKSEAPSTKS